MSIIVTVTSKSRNKDYFQQQSLPAYSYESSYSESKPILPRASTQTLNAGNNEVLYKKAFPAGSTVIVWVYTYDSNGYQVGNSVSGESVTGFTIYVPKNCTLKYIATIEN
jgi:hypothetical protein